MFSKLTVFEISFLQLVRSTCYDIRSQNVDNHNTASSPVLKSLSDHPEVAVGWTYGRTDGKTSSLIGDYDSADGV